MMAVTYDNALMKAYPALIADDIPVSSDATDLLPVNILCKPQNMTLSDVYLL